MQIQSEPSAGYGPNNNRQGNLPPVPLAVHQPVAEPKATQNGAQVPTVLPVQAAQTRGIANLFQPVIVQVPQTIANALVNVVVFPTMLATTLAQVAGQIAGFFRSDKKHRIEEDQNRGKEDFADPESDFITKRTVESPSGSGGGGKR